MSPMMVSASDIRPPAPRPCTARNAASSYIDVAVLHSREPITKTVMANMKKGLRP
ncbi:hypothetical protein TSOC111612_23370 [Tsukamurella ocularis]